MSLGLLPYVQNLIQFSMILPIVVGLYTRMLCSIFTQTPVDHIGYDIDLGQTSIPCIVSPYPEGRSMDALTARLNTSD